MAVMGSSTIRLLQSPTLTPVNPAMAACTAFCPSIMQYMLSAALAGTLRIMYDLHSGTWGSYVMTVTRGNYTWESGGVGEEGVGSKANAWVRCEVHPKQRSSSNDS
jgi:hypothetical protein